MTLKSGTYLLTHLYWLTHWPGPAISRVVFATEKSLTVINGKLRVPSPAGLAEESQHDGRRHKGGPEGDPGVGPQGRQHCLPLRGTGGHSWTQSINQSINLMTFDIDINFDIDILRLYPTWSRHIPPCMALNEKRYCLLYTCTVPTCVVNELHPIRDEEQVRPADVGLPLLHLPHQSWEEESLK